MEDGEVEERDDVDRGIYEDGVGDSRAVYEDGAYYAAPIDRPSNSSELSTDRDPQQLYYSGLLKRFESLRHILLKTPPRHAVERLDTNHGRYMSSTAKDYKTWRWRLLNTDPLPAQLAGMDKATILLLLKMLADTKGDFLGCKGLVAGKIRDWKRTGRWVWGLLARLPERGMLVSEEVGVVRELGKRAVWVGVEMQGVDMGGLDEGGELVDEQDEEVDVEEEVIDMTIDIEDHGTGYADSDIEDEGLVASDDDDPVGCPELSLSRHADTITHSDKDPDSDPNTTTADNIDDSNNTSDSAADLAAAQARLLARLATQDEQLNPEDRPATELEVQEASTDQEDNDSNSRMELKDMTGEQAEQEKQEGENRKDEEIDENEEDDTSKKFAIKAVLDMIITIASEVYGQRDLLEFREVWDKG
jgi:hypothetical protein